MNSLRPHEQHLVSRVKLHSAHTGFGMTKMTKEETKREVIDLYRDWPGRTQYDDIGNSALAFYGWMQIAQVSVDTYGNFGPGDRYQVVKIWITEWENTIGKIERARRE